MVGLQSPYHFPYLLVLLLEFCSLSFHCWDFLYVSVKGNPQILPCLRYIYWLMEITNLLFPLSSSCHSPMIFHLLFTCFFFLLCWCCCGFQSFIFLNCSECSYYFFFCWACFHSWCFLKLVFITFCYQFLHHCSPIVLEPSWPSSASFFNPSPLFLPNYLEDAFTYQLCMCESHHIHLDTYNHTHTHILILINSSLILF